MNGHALPWVLKIGGHELTPGPGLAALAELIAGAQRNGQPVVIVHGGGEEVTERAAALGLATERRDGQRITDEPMLEVVTEVLAGRVNVRLVQALEEAGVPAVGLTGVSSGLLRVEPAGDPPGSLGRVGNPVGARTSLLAKLLAEGWTPVVAPLGVDASGAVHNVNADLAAGAIAAALDAELLLLTDVSAVRGDDGEPVAHMDLAGISTLIGSGGARDGMVPKLEGARAALDGGAPIVWIGNLDGLTSTGPRPAAGTRIVRDADRARSLSSVARTPVATE